MLAVTLVGLVAIALVAAVALSFRPIDATSETASASGGGAEAGAPDLSWVFFSQLPPEVGPGAFVVQAGRFGEAQPRVDVEVPWEVDTAVDISRTPAVARPAAGAVVFVADDGDTSTIHRLAVEQGATPEAVAQLDDAVWSIAAAPDGSSAYLAVVARGRPEADLGVFRVAMDGSGVVEPFLPPVALDPAGGIRLAAVAPFMVTLDISADGRYLARTACRGAAGCTTSLIELSSKDVRELENMMLVDLGTGGLIVADHCHQAGCTAKLIDVESGATVDLSASAWDTTVTMVSGAPVVVAIESDGVRSSVTLIDPRSGARRELYRAPENNWLVLGRRAYLVAATDGAVLIVESSDGGGQMRQRFLMVPLDGGAPIDLPAPAIRQIGPPAAKG
jgi:hypothetical protein